MVETRRPRKTVRRNDDPWVGIVIPSAPYWQTLTLPGLRVVRPDPLSRLPRNLRHPGLDARATVGTDLVVILRLREE